MEKVFVLVGIMENEENVTLLSSWDKFPSQEIIDGFISRSKNTFERFAILQDILFIPGDKIVNSGYDHY